jgi:hypothetical protein
MHQVTPYLVVLGLWCCFFASSSLALIALHQLDCHASFDERERAYH